MLSNDELKNGRTFILKLASRAGVASQWVETFYGDTARRWYTIYRDSDWPALRAGAAAAFTHAVSADDAERIRRLSRCVVIHPNDVRLEELAPGDAAPLAAPAGPPIADDPAAFPGLAGPPAVYCDPAASPALLDRDQLDARLVDGDRLLLVHEGIDAAPHCRVLYREEEVPMEIFTEYRDLGLIRSTGDPDVFM